MTNFVLVHEPSDICPACKVKAPRVHNDDRLDALGRGDEYVCDTCKLIWPTEWADAYKFGADV